ncbi:hypothetical protein [Roseateles koreensis]|uniref:Uncharacterized protein n=1 Tax=Roseateles koreensis TaxID=2987526 RepID=A0ABT5KXX7_9BURK|nr:hypothetical protein [Roseateles koreensis]MDC8787235.1 hypothetical protein [Roseateles koreensis]
MSSIHTVRERSRLGQLLVEKGVISKAQLNQAIDRQKDSGKRLGEILTELNLATQRQINGVLRRQKHLRLAAAVVTSLLGPMQAFASAAAPVPLTQISAGNTPSNRNSSSNSAGGLQPLSDDEMGSVSAQGITHDSLLALAKNSKDGSSLQELVLLMNPVLQMFESDTSMKNVVYDPENAKTKINKDGSVTLSLPSTIGELNFNNIRVKGDTSGPTFGSIQLSNIDLRGTTITLTHH